MQQLAVICDLAAALFLAVCAIRGAGGRPLPALVPFLALGLGFAALAALLAAEPSFGGSLLILLAVGIGCTLGAAVALSASLARVPLFLTGLLILYAIVAILLASAIVDSGSPFWKAGTGAGDIERLGAATVAMIAGCLVLGGGSVLLFRRVRAASAGEWFGGLRRLQAVSTAMTLLLAGVFLVTHSPLTFWLCAVTGVLAGALLVLPMGAKARWPLSILLTGLCGLSTAALGFALASLVMIAAGGLVAASMASVLADLARDAGRRPLLMLFYRQN